MSRRRPRIVLVGAGGLGCAAAPVLAAAARALEIVVVDDDRVEAGNLHRQVLHRAADVGIEKAVSLSRAIGELAAGRGLVEARALVIRAGSANAREIVRGAAAVIDGSDNFPTRFLVNDACAIERVPLVHAAAIGWQGQVLAAQVSLGGPCYRCLFEAPPAAPAAVSCQEAGVAGPVVGVIGALAAEAALALVEGRSPYEEAHGQLLGRLLAYDGRRGVFRAVRFRKNPGCLACGTAPLERLLPSPAYEVPAC